MLILQSRAQAFGPILRAAVQHGSNVEIFIATAWVRASGLIQVQDALITAIENGVRITVVVGIDADNTSTEGLAGLLAIAATGSPGQVSLFVRHNEAGPLFHPKLYAFWREDEVLAYVGSNNLTKSGLFLNDELSALLTEEPGGPLDLQLRNLVPALTDLEDPLNRALTPDLLTAMVELGYVQPERRLVATSRARSLLERVRDALFGRENRAAPRTPVPLDAPVQADNIDPAGIALRPDWHVVYLRVRLARGTQTQIPVGVVREIRRKMGLPDNDDPLVVYERTTGEERQINAAHARGAVNTYKFEASEADGEPLLVIEPVGEKLFFEFLDSADPVGAEIMTMLESGFDMDPPRSFQTSADRNRSTWFRFE